MYVMRREPDSIEYPNSSLRAMAGGTTQEQVAPLQSFSFPLVTDRKFETKKSPLPGGGHYRRSAARQNEVGLAARAAASCRAPSRAPPSCIAIAMRPCSRSSLCDYAKNVYNLVTRRREGMFYPDEIEIQEPHSKHRKLDSQAALPHPTRNRAAYGLRPQAWPLRASRRDHDPGRLSARFAGLGGLRPAMAADRTVRGPPPRSPRQERRSQRASDPR